MHEVVNPKLSDRTTLHLGGKAIAELILDNLCDLEKLSDRIKSLGGQPVIIGKGSNLLAWDGNLPLVLIRPEFENTLKIIGKMGENFLLRASANIPFARVLKFCLRNGLSGLEGLAGIPGTVGGMIWMNAGSFGSTIGSCLHEIKIFDYGRIKTIKSDQLFPHYRKLNFEDATKNPIILEGTFALTQASKNVIYNLMSLNYFMKKSKQPLGAWSAGCAFMNPPQGDPAGMLLEAAGFRGKESGGMTFSAMHANFLVNTGNGSARAAIELLCEARDAVKKMFGITLEPEIRIIPWPLP